LDDRWEDRDGWTTEGPEKDLGIKFDNVDLSSRSKSSMTQGSTTFNLPCGQLVVVTGGTSAARSSILSLIWGDSWVNQRGGLVTIHGRDLKEWNKAFLRSKIAYLRDHENELHLQAGMVAGLRPGSTDYVRAQMLAIEASGARNVFDSLPEGPFTELKTFENAGTGLKLPTYQWRCLAVSRALCSMGKDIVLLDSVSEHMSELEEKKLLRFIRAQIRPDQVVVIASPRSQVASMADKVVSID
jgi:ABC-type multidrug transport system fused ATPase/permease subunit